MAVEHYSTRTTGVEIDLRRISAINEEFDSHHSQPSLPLMFYRDSDLRISGSTFQILFDPYDSLRCCRVMSPVNSDPVTIGFIPVSLRDNNARSKYMNQLKVQHSNLWKSTRDLSSIPELHTETDWTFTTSYWGTVTALTNTTKIACVQGIKCSDDFFPMDKLRDTSRSIQVFRELLMWEDELDDNGHAQFKVRYRLMEDFLFILATFELRVDGVLSSRSLETRIYVDLSGPPTDPTVVLREFKWMEAGTLIPDLWTQETTRIV